MSRPPSAPRQPDLVSVTTIRSDGSRNFLYPADVRGKWNTLRRLSGALLIAL